MTISKAFHMANTLKLLIRNRHTNAQKKGNKKVMLTFIPICEIVLSHRPPENFWFDTHGLAFISR